MKRQKGSLRAAGSLSVFQNPTLPGNPWNRYAIASLNIKRPADVCIRTMLSHFAAS